MGTNTNNPGAQITKAWKQMADAVRLNEDRTMPLAERILASRVAHVIAMELNQLQQEAREAFAKSRSWRYNSKRWMSDRPVIHHAEFYDDIDGNAVGLVTHCYASLDDVAKYATDYGLKAESLPFSWWAPQAATAVLLTLKAGGEWPTQRVRNERAPVRRKAFAAQKRAHVGAPGADLI